MPLQGRKDRQPAIDPAASNRSQFSLNAAPAAARSSARPCTSTPAGSGPRKFMP